MDDNVERLIKGLLPDIELPADMDKAVIVLSDEIIEYIQEQVKPRNLYQLILNYRDEQMKYEPKEA